MFFEALGWSAVFLFISSHIYISIFTQYNRNLFFIINTIGAIFMLVSSWAISSWILVIYNIIWLAISLAPLFGKSQINSPLNKKSISLITYVLIISSIIALPFNYIISIGILGYGSIVIRCCNYLLFATKDIEKITYLKFYVLGMAISVPQLFIDLNTPGLVCTVLYTVVSAYGIITYYLDKQKESKKASV